MSGRRFDLARNQRGAITWVSLLLVIAIAVGAYLGWVWLPIYYENYAVKQVVRDYMHQAIKNPDDQVLRSMMVQKIRSLAQVDGVDKFGRPARVPAIALEDGDVTWERDRSSRPPMLRVSFDYVRDVQLPLLERTTTKVFTVDISGDLERPDWGPSR